MANVNPFSALNQLFNAGHQKFNQLSPFNHAPANAEPRPATANSDVKLSDKNVIGLSVVYQSFSEKFAAFSSFEQGGVAKPEEDDVSLFDYEKVAENVLGFIGKSIQAAKARGVDSAGLDNMFEQARTGVEQGIDEAKEQLTQLNLLDEELEQGIEQGRTLINQGIDKLYDDIITVSPIIEDEEPDQHISVPEHKYGFLEQAAPSFASSFSSDSYFSQKLSSDLMIETADGDVVTISFSHFQEQMSSKQGALAVGDNFRQASFASSSSSYQELNFSFSVDGSLDKDEQKAIGALIKDINKLQKEFFEGDIEKAFEQALKLGFDTTELQGFSLDLEKTTTSIMTQTYQEVAQSPINANELAKHTRPLFDFAEQFAQIQHQSEQLFNTQVEQLQQLMDKVFEFEFGHFEDSEERLGRFNRFIDRLK